MEKTKTNLNNLEVLSPAGNAEGFYAAINNGADAVYLGLSKFNARMKAENFSTDNIREFVKFAHTFGVKVYVTINTLFDDDNINDLIEMINEIIDAKIDAFIVQDLGVAYLLKSAFPGIILHASTQMGIHNLDGAKVAEKLGFSRIVLSRETSIQDIKQIKQNTNLEIEYFVQGALCVAFSGNCYLSALENGMSGNEGKCLQLCRLPYTNNKNNETSYALSTRDLCLLDNLKELIDAGVTSFKIEGRLRHAGYTATATNIYKNAINLIKCNKFNEKFIKNSKELLKITFSRGNFNNNAYLYHSAENEVMFSDYQNHIGTKIGIVKSVEPFKNDLFKVTISSSHNLADGDGLKIINPKTKTQVSSLGVGGVQKLQHNTFVFFTKNKFSSGLDVHLTQDSKNEEKLLKNTRKIKINIKIVANFGKKLKVFAENRFAKIYFESDENLEKAKNNPLSEEDFKSQFSKLGNTPFELSKFKVQTNGVFLPKSMLNKLRIKMVELLQNQTITENEKDLFIYFDDFALSQIKDTQITTNPKNICIVNSNNFEVSSNTIYVYLPDDFANCNALEIIEKVQPENFALCLPTIIRDADKFVFEKLLNSLPKNISIFVNNVGGLNYHSKYNLITSPLLNIKNKYAIKFLNTLNVSTICSSIETSADFSKTNNLVWFESGNFPVMTFAHCPYKVITKSNCTNCKFDDNLTYSSQSNKTYKIKRTKLSNCYFTLNKELFRENLQFNLKNFVH